LGLWTHVEFQRKPASELRLAWLVPPEIAPIKLSGVLEIQTGPRFSFDVNDQGLTLALYYHNFYGRLFSWYVNAPSWTWIRRQPDLSYFSFGRDFDQASGLDDSREKCFSLGSTAFGVKVGCKPALV